MGWEKEAQKPPEMSVEVGRLGGYPCNPVLVLLTHNQLPHFLPADQAACFMHQGDSDSPLDALKMPRAERIGW